MLSVELGGDPPAASGGADVDLGDRAGVGDLEEHGAGGASVGRATEVRRKPAGSIVDAVELRIRELLKAYPTMPATVIAERIG